MHRLDDHVDEIEPVVEGDDRRAPDEEGVGECLRRAAHRDPRLDEVAGLVGKEADEPADERRCVGEIDDPVAG